MINQIYVTGEWIDGEPTTEGQEYREKKPVGTSFSYVYKTYSIPVMPTIIDVTGIVITGGTKEGEIYWVQKGQAVTLNANVSLPDGQLMMMIEKSVAAGTRVVDDTRTIAAITAGTMSATFTLPETGNWFITAERLNAGLKYINAGFELNFESVEFDVYD